MFQKLKVRPLLFLLAIAMLAFFLMLPTNEADAINTPWLSVSGRFIKDPQGNNVELRGVSLIDVGVADTRARNARQLIGMATNEADGWYARVVRLPVYPEAIDFTPGWNANPDDYFNNHLNPAIQECVARQIYCIIDWHYISDYTSSTINTSTRNFWSYVAPKYANTPNVIFELFNEPINPDNWSTWRTTAQPWVNLIRSYAPNNLILIGGPRWSQNLSSAPSQPFTGSNLVYVAHIYPQHGGQSTWDSWFGNAANSVPFFITEWGWQQGGNAPTSGTLSAYGIPFSNYLESKGLSWTAWVFDQWWQPVMFDENYNLLGGENYMGMYTRDLLYSHRNEGLPGGTPPATTPPVTTPPVTTPPVTTPPATTPPVTTPPPGSVSINSGGPATGSFTADQYFSGGSTYTNTRTIDVSQIPANTAPAAIFSTERYGAMTYTIPNRSGTQTVTLYFVETYVTAAGQRVFNVSINGTTVLSNFDIFASAGGANRAIARSFTTTANSSGQVVIQFTAVTQNPKISGLTVSGGGTPPVTTPPPTTPPVTTPPVTTPPATTPPVTTPPPTTPPPTTPPPTTPPPTTPPGGACSPVTSTITVPFTYDGAGTFCWQTSRLGSYINSWNVASLTINGVDFTNRWANSYPPAINGSWYIRYQGNFSWSHFEAR